MAHEDSARHIGGLLRLMAARGLTPAEIIEASWSERHGRISHLTIQLHADRTCHAEDSAITPSPDDFSALVRVYSLNRTRQTIVPGEPAAQSGGLQQMRQSGREIAQRSNPARIGPHSPVDEPREQLIR